MDKNKNSSEPEEKSVLSIIQDIKNGILSPRTLSKEARQRCVEFLDGDGYKEPQIAQILMRCEKTVYRDLKDIEDRNSMSPSVESAKKIIGNMFQKAMVHHKYLMRLARSTEATHGERAQSEFLAWRTLKEVVEKLQTLGYLPLKPQEIIEDIFHHAGDVNDERSITEAKSVLTDIETAAKIAGTLDPETESKIKALKSKIEKAEINNDVNKLTKEIEKTKDKKEAQNE
jgi:transposase